VYFSLCHEDNIRRRGRSSGTFIPRVLEAVSFGEGERTIAKEGQMTAQLGRIQPLRELLLEIGEVDIEREEVAGWLFLPQDERWTLDAPAVLLELNAVPPGTKNEKEVETPELAKSHHLKRVLLGADIQGIIDNARQQKPDVDLDEIFSAILYYWEFDAYKDFSE
jgi:hypothetical protein